MKQTRDQAIQHCIEAAEAIMQRLGKERRGQGVCVSVAQLRDIERILGGVLEMLRRTDAGGMERTEK